MTCFCNLKCSNICFHILYCSQWLMTFFEGLPCSAVIKHEIKQQRWPQSRASLPHRKEIEDLDDELIWGCLGLLVYRQWTGTSQLTSVSARQTQRQKWHVLTCAACFQIVITLTIGNRSGLQANVSSSHTLFTHILKKKHILPWIILLELCKLILSIMSVFLGVKIM